MKHLLTVVLTIFLMSGIWSCSRTVYVPVESSSVHSELRSDSSQNSSSVNRIDSVLMRDTVFVVERGDSVIKTAIRWRERIRIRTDTVVNLRDRFIFVHDSIDRPVHYPVTKNVYVEKTLSAWQKFRLGSFWVLTAALALSMIYIFRRPLLRLMCRLRL